MMDGLNSKEECLTDGRPRFIVPTKFIESFPTPLRYIRVRPELKKLGSGRMADWDDDKGDLLDNVSNKAKTRRQSTLNAKQNNEPKHGW
jgi:hypothetical protein